MVQGKKILGVIPARGGSKRVPRKNILPINGKPLIAYAIESALKANLDRVIVSTDDTEIAEIARRYGADVPFLRPKELAADDTPDAPVLRHALEFLEQAGERYDYVVLLRPTTPFKTADDINEIIKKAVSGSFDLVRSVTAAEGTSHPYWMYKADTEDTLKPLFEKENVSKYLRSQQLPNTIFSLNGVVDIFSTRQVKEAPNLLMSDRLGFIKIPRERALDIDEPLDFEIARAILEKMDEEQSTTHNQSL